MNINTTRLAVLSLLLSLVVVPVCLAEAQCLDAEGEAVIVNNDTASAKADAVSRAKWAAIEQAVGVEVKAQSVIQNLMMVDESVSRQIHGAVTSHKILEQSAKDDVMSVRINACVEPARAKDAVAGLALNNSISVFILAKNSVANSEGYQESNLLSEALIGKLADQGYTVVDTASSGLLDDQAIDSAIKSGKILGLRNLMYKFLSNILLVGKVEYAHTQKKGEDVGWGISMPFNSVTARLTYRLISRNSAGEMVILAAGTEQGRGLAPSTDDAAAKSLKELTDKVALVVLAKAGEHIKGVTKRVQIRVKGVSDLNGTFAVKEQFQNIAWVTSVEEKGLGEFTVGYQENPIYLANSIEQKGDFKIESFTPQSITVRYVK